MAPHSSTLAWKVPWTEKPGGLQSMGSQRVKQDSATSLSLFTFMHWRRKWHVNGVAQSRTRLKGLSSSSSSGSVGKESACNAGDPGSILVSCGSYVVNHQNLCLKISVKQVYHEMEADNLVFLIGTFDLETLLHPLICQASRFTPPPLPSLGSSPRSLFPISLRTLSVSRSSRPTQGLCAKD